MRANVVSGASCDIREFNEFIEGMELVYIPIHNRRCTLFRSGGQEKSRIDSVVVCGVVAKMAKLLVVNKL